MQQVLLGMVELFRRDEGTVRSAAVPVHTASEFTVGHALEKSAPELPVRVQCVCEGSC